MALVWDKTLFDEMYTSKAWRHGVRGVNRLPHFHYHWFGQGQRLRYMIGNLVTQPGWASVSHVAIMGGGFGWTAEILADLGITAISIDTSPYVIANENVSEEAELRDALTAQGFDPDNLPTFMSDVDPNVELTSAEVWAKWLRPDGLRTSIPVAQEDLFTQQSRNRVKQRLANNMDGILTEYLLDAMQNDTESLLMAQRAQQLRPNPACAVIHMVADSNTGDVRLNNKTMAEWRTLLDINGFNDHYVVDAAGRVL